MDPLADIPGWLLPPEARVLAECARGKAVLEIGSYLGRSTVVMARVARVVHAIDWGRGDAGAGFGRTTAGLLANLDRFGVAGRVVVHVGAAAAVGPALRDGYFDFAFVDGAHDEASVAADLALARRAVRVDGAVALHDWQQPGVLAAARSVLWWRPDDGQGVTLESVDAAGAVYRMHVRRLGG